jgi:hypothetical protein
LIVSRNRIFLDLCDFKRYIFSHSFYFFANSISRKMVLKSQQFRNFKKRHRPHFDIRKKIHVFKNNFQVRIPICCFNLRFHYCHISSVYFFNRRKNQIKVKINYLVGNFFQRSEKKERKLIIIKVDWINIICIGCCLQFRIYGFECIPISAAAVLLLRNAHVFIRPFANLFLPSLGDIQRP